MLFNSIQFLIFLPVVLSLYFVTPFRFRWLVLLISSCYFYMVFIPQYILILAFTIVIDYFVGVHLERIDPKKKKFLLITSLFANILVLFIFKYYNFFIRNVNSVLTGMFPSHESTFLPALSIILPIGLSFHTFQSMSYIIEVYWGKQKAEQHFGYYWVYVMYFPQLVAGPIERPQHLIYQLHQDFKFSLDRMSQGIKLMIIGFFMKIVVSDRLSLIVDQVYKNPSAYGGEELTLATYFFAFQIYCDFAGYSSIAIGVSQIFGIELMQNFRFPYFSKSISEFWTRWHISLSGWFRDYLYIPLGGSRQGMQKHLRNLFIVFVVSGLWHGANWTFLVWGGLHACYATIEVFSKGHFERFIQLIKLNRFPILLKTIQVIFVFHLALFAWIFFRASSMQDAIYIITHFYNFTGIPTDNLEFQLNKRTGVLVILLLLLVDSVRVSNIIREKAPFIYKYRLNYLFYAFLLNLIFLAGVFYGSGFIYFQF